MPFGLALRAIKRDRRKADQKVLNRLWRWLMQSGASGRWLFIL